MATARKKSIAVKYSLRWGYEHCPEFELVSGEINFENYPDE
jgi:hypothetical protein